MTRTPRQGSLAFEDDVTRRIAAPEDDERTIPDLWRPEPTFEVEVVTAPDGLPRVSVRPVGPRRATGREESTWRGPRPSGEHTRLLVGRFRRTLRWRAFGAWAAAFGLGGSAMAGAVAVLFFAGLLPVSPAVPARGAPGRDSDGAAVESAAERAERLEARMALAELEREAEVEAAAPAALDGSSRPRSASRPLRRRAARRAISAAGPASSATGGAAETAPRSALPNAFVAPAAAPAPEPLGISESAGF